MRFHKLVVLALALSVSAVFGEEQDEDLLNHPKLRRRLTDDGIPDSYVVVLNSNVGDVQRKIERILNQAERRDHVTHVYRHALKGFAVKNVRGNRLRRIMNDPDVTSVDQDAVVEADGVVDPAPSWGTDRTDQPSGTDGKYTFSCTGAGVDAYILDTGITTSHADFGGRVASCVDFAGSRCSSGFDVNSHGTHVAGTVGGNTFGMASGVTLHDVRVLGDSGSGSYAGVVAGVDYVAGIKSSNPTSKMVANMSLGGGGFSDLDTAVNTAVGLGVVFAVAAGNSNANACNYSPARAANALTVGSTTTSDSRSSFSNYGACVDIYAPGSGITSANNSGSGSSVKNGTSMASPHVAGAAALALESGSTSVESDLVGAASSGIISGIPSGANLFLYVGGLTCSGGGTTPAPTPVPTTNGSTPAPTPVPSIGSTPAPTPQPTIGGGPCLGRRQRCNFNYECCSDNCRFNGRGIGRCRR